VDSTGLCVDVDSAGLCVDVDSAGLCVDVDSTGLRTSSRSTVNPSSLLVCPVELLHSGISRCGPRKSSPSLDNSQGALRLGSESAGRVTSSVDDLQTTGMRTKQSQPFDIGERGQKVKRSKGHCTHLALFSLSLLPE